MNTYKSTKDIELYTLEKDEFLCIECFENISKKHTCPVCRCIENPVKIGKVKRETKKRAKLTEKDVELSFFGNVIKVKKYFRLPCIERIKKAHDNFVEKTSKVRVKLASKVFCLTCQKMVDRVQKHIGKEKENAKYSNFNRWCKDRIDNNFSLTKMENDIDKLIKKENPKKVSNKVNIKEKFGSMWLKS